MHGLNVNYGVGFREMKKAILIIVLGLLLVGSKQLKLELEDGPG